MTNRMQRSKELTMHEQRTPRRYTGAERGQITHTLQDGDVAMEYAKRRSWRSGTGDDATSPAVVVRAHWSGDTTIINWRHRWVNGQLVYLHTHTP
jgi:hypothetical protein